MRNRIWHNYPSLIQCLRAFHILIFAKLLLRCHCYDCYKNCYCYFCHRYCYLHTTLLLNTLLQLLSLSGVVELTTQLLILENILWFPLCRINKFGLNALPSKTVAIPYTCGLSRPSNSWSSRGTRESSVSTTAWWRWWWCDPHRASPKHCNDMTEVEICGGGHHTRLKNQLVCLWGAPLPRI